MSKEITIAAVGDLLMKPLIVRLLRNTGNTDDSDGRSGNTYDFEQVFEPVAPYLRDADLTIGNLETTFAGGGDKLYTQPRRHPKTRNPLFQCPDALAPTLKASGFHVLTTANNHCMDYGVKGLARTLKVLDRNGIAHTGTYRTRKESRSLCVHEAGGIRIGILAYTRDTNRIPIPKGQPAGVNKIVRATIKNDLERMRAVADFIVVCLHSGYEYHRNPSTRQKDVVQFLFRHGADVVLGAHPHVLQPAVWRTVKDVYGRTKKRFAIYSMGNFISSMLHGRDDTLTGVIVRIKLRRTAAGSVRVTGVEYVPTWVCIDKTAKRKRCRVVAMQQALRKADGVSAGQIQRIKRAYQSTLRLYKGVMSPVGE